MEGKGQEELNGVVDLTGDGIDCKTLPIFASSNTREPSNKRSGTRLKTESEIEEIR